MQEWRKQSLFYSIIIMMGSLFFSRAMLSVSLMGFIALSFFHRGTREQFRNFFSTPLLWVMSLLFLLPLISGVWSEDKVQWQDVLRIKLPFLFLPLAFAGPFSFSKKQWNALAFIFLGLIVGGTAWSLFHYAGDTTAINEGYLRAKSMITPLKNDHVRFSWLVNVAVIVSGWYFTLYRKEKKQIAWIFLILALWLILFLHILAARTGLISFYISVLMLAIWLIIKKMRWRYAVGLLILVVTLPVLSYYLLPSFHNRARYFIYDFDYFKNASYLPGSNDGVRVISLKAGWKIMMENKWNGVGFGDLLAETKKYYASAYPEMLEQDKIYPSSEWLVYGGACGIPGFCLFTLIMILPFFLSIQLKILWWILNATAAFSFIADIGLEVQFGVFIYSFIVLWWWKWLKDQKV